MNSPVWQTITAFISIVGAIAIVVSHFGNPQRSQKTIFVIICLAVITILVSGWVVFAFTPSPQNTSENTNKTSGDPFSTVQSPAATKDSTVQSPTTTDQSQSNSSIPLYRADFQKEAAEWGANNFTVDSTGLSCQEGKTLCSAEANFLPSSPDYKVVIKMQVFASTTANPFGNVCVRGRVNSQYPEGIGIEIGAYYHNIIQYCSGHGVDQLGNLGVGINPFTETITYKGTNVDILISQAGYNATFEMNGGTNTGQGKVDIVSTTSIKIFSFEIYPV